MSKERIVNNDNVIHALASRILRGSVVGDGQFHPILAPQLVDLHSAVVSKDYDGNRTSEVIALAIHQHFPNPYIPRFQSADTGGPHG